MIWLLLALTALLVALVLIIGRGRGKTVDPLDHYRAQLDEITEDEARGVVDAESARAARLEVERRILKVAKQKTSAGTVVGDKRLPVLLAAVTLVAAFTLYGFMGRPDLPAKPGMVASSLDQLVEEGGPTFGEAIKSIQKHLKDAPQDQKAWEILAKTSRSVRDFSTAANAFGQLAMLDPTNATWRAQQLEAMIAMSGGQISPATRLVLGKLIEEFPDHAAGQYYLGLARLQAGDEVGAKATWTALADRSAPDAPWMPVLRRQLSSLGVAPPKLTDEQVASVENMTEDQRRAFIASMMARLEAKLESAPDDAEGWMMLARSYLAMGDQDAAIDALERGLSHVSGEKAAVLQAFLDNLTSNPDL
ncbi:MULTISPECIES: c-type cytochrome biogenesis protein CcmI [Kordiimonas]|jgi:cytochrome c-type biogenesis protein CcmH|uniref:c-type cytochrome biogenesis protein CcmI n=1 Tax=Kordiimonas TaxID=288021 RepID=UPI00257B09A4|nr:c-type cytochrome biogenesis protein CcmI [Kordiimonas sp. UBA4487]